jgi:hypothetical protein
MDFRGKRIRAATVPMFVVDREYSKGVAGLKMMRHLFQGPQDLSFADGAGNEASSIYTAAGARVCRLYSFNWIRLLRPFGAARSVLDRVGPLSTFKGAAGLVTKPMDVLLSKLPITPLRCPKAPLTSRPTTPIELMQCIQQVRPREALTPHYSSPSFEWLISEAGAGHYDALRLRLTCGEDGLPCGWFVYYASPQGQSFVLHAGSHRPTQFPAVLTALFEDAWKQGVPLIKGQAIPSALVALTEQYCFFRQPHARMVGFAREPEILSAFQCGDAALSRLDAGFWLRFSTEARLN